MFPDQSIPQALAEIVGLLLFAGLVTGVYCLIAYFRSKPKWEYGTCKNVYARRNIKKRNVQFILWKAGDQGHKEDFWYDFDPYWWEGFKKIT